MIAPEVTLVRTGAANLASVRAAFERLGAGIRITESAADVREAARVVLPGVGSFGAVRDALDARELAPALRERVLAGRPTLGICLGFQLLGAGSEESPGVPGLDLLPLTARRFEQDRPVPQLGWNRVVPDGGGRCVASGHAYFANSYRFTKAPEGGQWAVTWADYGGPFLASVERGPVVACQFHPELSGAFGASILASWLAEGEAC